MAYKQAKEHFVAHGAGSSIADIHAVTAVGWTSNILYASLVSRGIKANPITDYLVAFLPLLLGQTTCAAHPLAFNGAILSLALVIRSIPHRTISPFKDEPLPPPPPPPATTTRHRPFLTTWRAHMMCMTVIAILAVDFPLFPRAFAKTESFGTSLVSGPPSVFSSGVLIRGFFFFLSFFVMMMMKMDVGVGSFVFSQGVASSASRAPSSSFRRTITRCAPVVALGMIRVIMVKGVDYPVRSLPLPLSCWRTRGLIPWGFRNT